MDRNKPSKPGKQWWTALYGLIGLGVALALAITLLRGVIITRDRTLLIIFLALFIVSLYFRNLIYGFILWALKILNEKK